MKNSFLYISFCIIIFLANSALAQDNSYQLLHDDWQYRQVNSMRWYPATVPGTIHTDLLSNHQIQDPFYRLNEAKAQWVSQTDWEYQTTFKLRKQAFASDSIYLQFDGLDTYADVFLNNVLILKADNMFRTYRVEVGEQLDTRNTLRIVFHQADKIVDSIAKSQLPLIRPCENNRNYARKAQYHFGWDWAPKLTTCGIWRDVKLCYGEQEEEPKSVYSNVTLIQDMDSIGQSFYFTVYGKPTFMKGANWIPADVFLPRITHDKYRNLLIAAKEANFNMLRVWGGGIYEDDYFYDLCDSLGIYVWQDFMFAGAMYPANHYFIENVKEEIRDNVIRLRKHPCIVLWCGNNEIDEAWHNWDWQKQFNISATDATFLWKEYKLLFEKTIPALLKELDPQRPYIASSPIVGWGRKESMTQGDSHYWGMWWGLEPIDIMTVKIPRFMSEYGMQAMPNIESVLQYALPQDMDTASLVMKSHQKHPTGYETLNTYLLQQELAPTTFEEYIQATQEVQSLALKTTITTQLNSNGRCMGNLFWQFNDCWPVCSWSVIDYYGRKKKAYETVKELYKEK